MEERQGEAGLEAAIAQLIVVAAAVLLSLRGLVLQREVLESGEPPPPGSLSRLAVGSSLLFAGAQAHFFSAAERAARESGSEEAKLGLLSVTLTFLGVLIRLWLALKNSSSPRTDREELEVLEEGT